MNARQPQSSAPSSDERSQATNETDENHGLFHLGPKKQVSVIDPLVHHGRHFGRTVRAFCRINDLLKRGVKRRLQIRDSGEGTSSDAGSSDAGGIYEDRIYQQLVDLCPGLEQRLLTVSDQELAFVASMILKGSSGARSDDAKSLKGVIIDWITPQGQKLIPPLTRNIKTDRGFHHERTGELLCPVGFNWSGGRYPFQPEPETTSSDNVYDARVKEQLRKGELAATGEQWPLFLYCGFLYDAENLWKGLFRSNLLVMAYKRIFTSPSSVDQESRATRLGNARIHGMTSVTIPSIAYIAMQVRFALSSTPTFSRNDVAADFERFYGSIVEFLEDPEEIEDVERLLTWWNRQVFRVNTPNDGGIYKNNVVAKIKEQRRRAALTST